MRQCPDCEEKDRVIIAGKVFCASCGAPWQTADKAEEEKYLQKVGLGTTPTPDPAKPAGGASMSTEAADPVAAALKAAGGSAPASTPPAPPAAAPTPPPAPAPSPTPPVAPVAAPAPAPPASITDTPASATPAPAPTPPAATPMTVPIGVPAATAQTAPPAAAAPPPPAQATEPSSVTPPTAQPVGATENLSSQTASEIPSLDSKEDPVLSDSQFSELAKTTVQPASTTPANTRSMNDVVVPAVSAASEITNPAPATPAPTPAPNPTPSPVASAATPNMTTVAGVTMSREDALKLALGDEVGADVATAADKEPKKGPAKPTAVVMSVIALVLLGAYLWQVNYPNFALRLAAMRAGVTSGMPGYVPTGWSEAKEVKTSQGTLSYSITKGDEKLTITEAKTSWDSQAVLEQHVLKDSTDYLALQAQGLTIYMYGKNQAAWVNHGSFYTMTGENQINQDDMIRIATSL